ncbi:hypothetical protein [Nostoc sp.]|uniref:hypothetical protein n=1 Tax=Nostoc sp. TaxID=1180 RepID=UPI002FF46787
MNATVNILTTHPETSLKQYLEQHPDYLLALRKACGMVTFRDATRSLLPHRGTLRATQERHFSRQTLHQLN